MLQVMGTISDGGKVMVRDLPILMQETQPPDGGAGWQGVFELPREVTPPHPQRFYRLQTSDGRTGQIVFVASDEAGGLQPSRLRFRTSGPFE
jgi:hypothetical protein